MKRRWLKMAVVISVLLCIISFTGCSDSGVNSVVVPEDAVSNVISGRFTNSKDNNIWQFNADGTLFIINEEKEESGEYDVRYDDESMYLTNSDGASISFFYKDNKDGTYDIIINGKNADTSTLQPIEKESVQ